MPLSPSAQERIQAFAFTPEARADAQALIELCNESFPDLSPAAAGLLEHMLSAQVELMSRTGSDTSETASAPPPEAPLVSVLDPEEFQRYQDCMAKMPPSAARSEQARINGSQSKGPTSKSGKLASRLGGLVHGMASELPILPGESEEDLKALIQSYQDDYETATVAERDLAEIAAHTIWKIRRCREADAAETKLNMAAVVDGFHDRSAAEVQSLVALLPENPPEAARQLRNSTQGVTWLLQQVEILENRLKSHRTLESSQRSHFIRISGYDPKMVLTCPFVTQINIAYLSGLHGKGGTDAAEAAGILQADRPEDMSPGEFERRLEVVMAGKGGMTGMETVQEGHRRLKGLVAALRRSLEDRFEVVDHRESRQLAEAFRGSKVATDAAGALRERYETGRVRLYLGTLHALNMSQRLRRKQEAGGGASRAPRVPRQAAGPNLRTEPKGSKSAAPEQPAPAAGQRAEGDVGVGAPGVAPGSSG